MGEGHGCLFLEGFGMGCFGGTSSSASGDEHLASLRRAMWEGSAKDKG